MKSRIMMVVFVLVLGSILTAALVAVASYTAPIIEQNEAVETRKSILQALGIPYDQSTIDEAFTRNVREKQADGTTYYLSQQGDIAFAYAGPGLWGPIEGIVAIGPDFRTLTGITIIRQEETPGLGSRIGEPAYLDQFKAKRFADGLRLVAPGRSQADNEIDSITGATLSSNAFVEILNNSLEKKVPVIKQGELQ
jgi:Na+-transporting NADH:ubiquinone oxidoreductase subunit C